MPHNTGAHRANLSFSEITLSQLSIERVDETAIVVLNRPGRHNALTGDLYLEIGEAVSSLIADNNVRCIVLAGAGTSFCGGFDLGESADHGANDDLWVQWTQLQGQRRVLKTLWDSPKPTICEAKGYCLGGGMSLLNQCDFVVAARDTVFGEPEMKFSLMPQPKLLYYMPLRQAKEIMLLGEQFSAEEGHRVGLVNRVVDPGQLRDTTLAMAAKLAAMPRETMQMAKRMINAALKAQGQELMDEWGWDDFLISKVIPTAQRQKFLQTIERDGLSAALREVKQRHDVLESR